MCINFTFPVVKRTVITWLVCVAANQRHCLRLKLYINLLQIMPKCKNPFFFTHTSNNRNIYRGITHTHTHMYAYAVARKHALPQRQNKESHFDSSQFGKTHSLFTPFFESCWNFPVIVCKCICSNMFLTCLCVRFSFTQQKNCKFFAVE